MAVETGHLRHPLRSHPRGPVSRSQVEALVSRAVAVFGVVFGGQTVPVMIDQLWEVSPVWAVLFVPFFYATLVVALVAAIAQRLVRRSQGAVAIVYLIGILTWPVAITEVTVATHSTYWLYYLLSVSTAMAAIAFTARTALGYLVVVPVVVAAVRVASGAVVLREGFLDSIYAILLGGAVLIIVTMLRQAASSVDTAQAAALETYAHAVRQHATEVERVQVDAIVHDSVLTTLLSAARAETAEEKELSSAMARRAIEHLRRAALVTPSSDEVVTLADLAARVTQMSATLGPGFELRTQDPGSRTITTGAAEAVYSAAVQAMVNSVQHAGAGEVHRWLGIRSLERAGVEIEVGDTGAGFLPWEVPAERLGVRVSIIERMANAGGLAEIDSMPGEGTVVTIRWPAVVV